MLRRYLPLFLLCSLSLSVPVQAQVTVRSQGQFTDKGGTRHQWYINAAHALIWDDAPFVPVGGLFQAASWTANSTEADFNSDVAALTTLRSHGVNDIYVQPARGGITAVSAQKIQRLLDVLDAQGFTYGISLNDGPREPLIGYIVRPGAFRQLVSATGGDARFTVPDLSSALYFRVVPPETDVREEGDATITGDGAVVSAGSSSALTVNDDPNAQNVVLLVPERIYTPTGGATIGGDIGMRNLWEGFDTYRDSVITLFNDVHPGKGFRFLCDPLPGNLALTDAFARFIPSSSAFRAEWAAYLGAKYRNVGSLMLAWGVTNRTLATFDDAAALLPLWSGGKGISFYYSVSTKKRLSADTIRSSYWNDLADFKSQSIRGYMNDLAVSLKRAVADVPVVYRNAPASGWNDLFAAMPATSGFDGVGIVAYGHGSDLAQRSAAYTFAQVAQAPKTVWLPVLATADVPYALGKATVGYDSGPSLTGSLDWMRQVGAKGFYVTGARIVDPARQPFNLLAAPEQLDWLQEYATALDGTGARTHADSEGANLAPPVIYYPRHELPDLSPTALSGSAGWWLPTDRKGVPYDFGTVGRAYAIDEPGAGTVYYLWSPSGTRQIHIPIPKIALNSKTNSHVGWSANANGEIKKDVLIVTIGPEPIRIFNLPTVPVPLEAPEAIKAEARALIKVAKADKDLYAERFGVDLDGIRIDKEAPYQGLSELLAFLEEIKKDRRDYLWIEAESTAAHSFDEASDLPGASGDHVLRVDFRLDDSPAIAQYRISVPDTKPFDVWVAMTPDAAVSLRLDGRMLTDTATIPQKVGNPYAGGKLVWTNFGKATLPKGDHLLEVRADSPALIDTILFTHRPFIPNGPNPPPILP